MSVLDKRSWYPRSIRLLVTLVGILSAIRVSQILTETWSTTWSTGMGDGGSLPSQAVWEVVNSSPEPVPQLPGFEWLHQRAGFDEKVRHAVQNMNLTTSAGEGLLFVGVFSTAADVVMRQLLRTTYTDLMPPGVILRFVICRPRQEGADLNLKSEMQGSNDLFLLDCTENINGGKTYEYFSSVRKVYPHYHYYMKVDQDSYVLWHNIAVSLYAAPRCGLYAGRAVCPDCTRGEQRGFQSGPGYILSKDLVQMLENCEPCAKHGSRVEAFCPGPGETASMLIPVLSLDFSLPLSSTSPDVLRHGEDIVTSSWMQGQVPDRLQRGDWTPHMFNIIDIPIETALNPGTVMAHFIKTPDLWRTVHQRVLDMLREEHIPKRGGDFTVFDGPLNYFWDPDCTDPKHTHPTPPTNRTVGLI